MQKFGNDSEATGRTSIVVRLRQVNEEKTLRSLEIQEQNREVQEEKHRQQKLTQLYTERKLDEFEKKKQLENQTKVEEAERKRKEVLVKNIQITEFEAS